MLRLARRTLSVFPKSQSTAKASAQAVRAEITLSKAVAMHAPAEQKEYGFWDYPTIVPEWPAYDSAGIQAFLNVFRAFCVAFPFFGFAWIGYQRNQITRLESHIAKYDAVCKKLNEQQREDAAKIEQLTLRLKENTPAEDDSGDTPAEDDSASNSADDED